MAGSNQTDDRPLGSYGAVITVYSTVVAGFALFMRMTGRRPPERLHPQDIAIVALATNKLSRLVSRDKVTSPIRAPFTELEEESPGEVVERPTGEGAQRAIGELLTCPFCLSQWIATILTFGLLVAPRATRVLGSVFAALAGADFLQLGYAIAERKTKA